jgi:uncharacterized protein YqgC (DUF456 family)
VTELLWVLALALVVAGFAGLVLPVMPGAVLIFAGLLLAAWADGFTRVGAFTLTVIGLLVVAIYVIELLGATLGAKRLGASKRAVTGAALGTVVGLFFGIPGLLLGPFLGAALGEWTIHRELRRAGGAGLRAWIGFVLGTGVKIALALSMVAIFFAAMFLF